MFRWLTRLFSKPRPIARPMATLTKVSRVQARYDAAQTTDENKKHWSVVDALGARSENSEGVRKELRDRARYEVANNSIARGMSLTVANDMVGTGPRLQLVGDENKEAARRVEELFAEHCVAIKLADKLRTMRLARFSDGDPFAMFTTNDALPTSVKLDMKVIECDQIADPFGAMTFLDPTIGEGIRFDTFGNPVAYYLYNEHPGDAYTFAMAGRWVPARSMIHWFRRERPGQIRGIPEITSALPLFAQLRRYTLSVIAAAESAADFAVLLSTNQIPDTGAEELVADFASQEITRRMMVALPPGYTAAQMKAEQPVTNYAMFKREILTEIARCLDMPYSIAAGDGSDSSYAGGRLEFQTWAMKTRVERSDCELVVLDPLFRAWLEEAVMVPGLLPPGIDIANLKHRWFWDQRPHVDPQKEANAFAALLEVNGTTYAEHYAARGQDWEDAFRQRAKEKALMKELGLTAADVAPVDDDEEMEDEEADEEVATA